MTKVNLQLFNAYGEKRKTVNPAVEYENTKHSYGGGAVTFSYSQDKNYNKPKYTYSNSNRANDSFSESRSNSITPKSNSNPATANYGKVASDSDDVYNGLVKQMMNNGMGYDASRNAVYNASNGSKVNYVVTGNGASPYNNVGAVANVGGSIANTIGKYKDLYSQYAGSLGLSGGLGKIGGFKASEAYNQAMAYTNSLLEKLNSGRTSYSDKIDSLMSQIEGRDKFSYDFNTDPLFQNALASAMQSGQNAMQDTIGQASSLTGGYGSSYATSAANQAYNSYIQDAYSDLPQYYNLALQAYQNEGNELYNQLGMYQTADATEYDRLSNAYSANLSNAQNMYNQEYNNYWDTANYNLNVDKYNSDLQMDYLNYMYKLNNGTGTSKTSSTGSTTAADGTSQLKSFLTATNNDDTLSMLQNYYMQGGSLDDESSEYYKALETLYEQGYDVDELDRWVQSQTATADPTGRKWYENVWGRLTDGGGYYNVTYPDGHTERVSASEVEKLRKNGVNIRVN